jgi:methylated-DNA-protein-cysteine methyltransferase-like protein
MRIDDAFTAAVHDVVRAVPAGEVVTYGEIAVEVGHPGQARAVGRVLGDSDGRLPWWRVVAADGRLVPGHEREQRRRLRAEGVATDERRVLGMRGRPRDGGPTATRQ